MSLTASFLRRRFRNPNPRFLFPNPFSSSSSPTREGSIETILVANRGEIACRVMRTAKRLGIRTVAVYSDADCNGMHVKLADVAVRIGPPPARSSYLNAAAIVEAAHRTGAQDDKLLSVIYHTSSYICLDHALITSLVEQWRLEINTFHIRIGKMIVTLKDVAPTITGRTDYDWDVLNLKLMGHPLPQNIWGAYLKLTWLRDTFRDLDPDATRQEIEQYT